MCVRVCARAAVKARSGSDSDGVGESRSVHHSSAAAHEQPPVDVSVKAAFAFLAVACVALLTMFFLIKARAVCARCVLRRCCSVGLCGAHRVHCSVPQLGIPVVMIVIALFCIGATFAFSLIVVHPAILRCFPHIAGKTITVGT
jgi:hypothetical protein